MNIGKTNTYIKEWKDQLDVDKPGLELFLKNVRKLNKENLIKELKDSHQEVFSTLDCRACANCCKTTPPLYTPYDMKRIAKSLGISPSSFKRKYTIQDINGEYVGISVPCTFLNEDQSCSIYEVRPQACREYPHTDDVQFPSRPAINFQNIKVCPAAYHIIKKVQKKIEG